MPGDKSISHRALMLGALATGVTRLDGLLEAEDVLNTAKALHALGAPIEKIGNVWRVMGRGVGGLRQPACRSTSATPAPARGSCSASSPATT